MPRLNAETVLATRPEPVRLADLLVSPARSKLLMMWGGRRVSTIVAADVRRLCSVAFESEIGGGKTEV
jgi:hypothetical protein